VGVNALPALALWLDVASRYRLMPATAEGECDNYLTAYEPTVIWRK